MEDMGDYPAFGDQIDAVAAAAAELAGGAHPMAPFHTGELMALVSAVAALLAATPDRARAAAVLSELDEENQATLEGMRGADGQPAPEACGYRFAMGMFLANLRG